LVLVPTAIILVSGLVLQLKKEVAWIQPPTRPGSSTELSLSFDQVLEAVQDVPEAQVDSWDDVDRLDVRPGKGMLKVRCRNRWEVQLDTKTGEVLQVAYRRSDLIESLHDGSFFHASTKLCLFLPSGFVLVVLWLTGIFMFFQPYIAKWKKRHKKRLGRQQDISSNSKVSA
jgi:uncharacterized iron-regulated membrane protein